MAAAFPADLDRVCLTWHLKSTENQDLEEFSLKGATGQCTQNNIKFSDGSKTLK